jgi:hypothetical protein
MTTYCMYYDFNEKKEGRKRKGIHVIPRRHQE